MRHAQTSEKSEEGSNSEYSTSSRIVTTRDNQFINLNEFVNGLKSIKKLAKTASPVRRVKVNAVSNLKAPKKG